MKPNPFIRLIVFLLGITAIVITSLRKGFKEAFQAPNMAILMSIFDIFSNLSSLKEAFKNFNSENIPEMAKEVRTNFVFYEDKDLELILEDLAIALLNFYASIKTGISVFNRLKAYLKTVPVESPKLSK